MRLSNLIKLVVLAGLPLAAQVPTISNIVVDKTGHSSTHLCFDVSPTSSYVQLFVGTVTSTYNAQHMRSYQATDNSTAGHPCFAVSGLADSTAYFARPNARPNAANDTNICNVAGCGASEMTFTTGSATIPVAPTAPTAYPAPNPDTSAYTIVRMVTGGAGGQCKANATVGPITYGGGSWTVTAGDLFQTVLNEVGYGAVLEIDQGVTCVVPLTSGTNNNGYLLPSKAVDPNASGINDAAHRFIVIRTKSVAASDFPPFGTRISPTLCTKCAILQANAQAASALQIVGRLFYTDNSGTTHHWIIQNVIGTVDQTITTGSWGELISFGSNSAVDYNSDYMVLDRVVLRGSSTATVDNERGIHFAAHHVAMVNSWLDQIWSPSIFPQCIFGDDGGTGPYNIDNNYVECVGMSFYQELNTGYYPAANDVSLTHNTFYQPLSKKDAGYFVRQPIEFKSGYRILIQGNLIDGSWVYQNTAPAVLLLGAGTYGTGGVSDANVNYNLIRNVATVFDCYGAGTGDPLGSAGGADSPIIQRVRFANNWAYNVGYNGKIGAGGGGGGLVDAYFAQRPGCVDVTNTQNTYGFLNAFDSRAASTQDYIPSIVELGGGSTFGSGYTDTNNIKYVSSGVSSAPYIWADDPQEIASHPKTPALDLTNPTTVLNTFFITSTNSGTTPSWTWTGNVNICGQVDAGSNSWSDMTSGQCTTAQTNMPSGDTWATGNTIAARESNVGFTPATGICSGCGGAGANIATLYTTMQLVTGISVTPASSSIAFSYTAPDTRACNVDTSTDNFSTWTRTTDAGGSSPRTPTVSGLSATTLYYYRILCYASQTSTLFSGSQVTDGTTTTLAVIGPSTAITGKAVGGVTLP